MAAGKSKTLLAVVAATALAAGPAAQERRPIADTDLLKFVWIADPQIAPDGARVAFVRVVVNEAEDRYETSLWLVSTTGDEAPRPLTSGTADMAPRWSPDGRWLAFLRAVQEEGRPASPQVYLMPTAGGEAQRLTSLPKAVGDLAWSPDGRVLAFSSTTTPADLAPAGPAKSGERSTDVRVITRAVYRSNGPGYLDPDRPSHLWTIGVPEPGRDAPGPVQITSGPFDEQGFVWAPDGSRIYFTSNRVDEPYYHAADADIYSVPATGGEIERVTGIDGPVRDLAPGRDGTRLAFIGAGHGRPVRSYNQTDLFVAASGDDAARNVTADYDFDVGAGLSGDQRAPRGALPSRPVWTADGRSIVAIAAEEGTANLKRIDAATGQVVPLTQGRQDVVSFTATPDGGTLVALIASPTNVGDLYLIDANASTPGPPRRLTRINETLWQALSLGEPEAFWYPGFGGRRIQGWILTPPDFDPSRKYPLVLQIHGGPHAAYGDTFTHEFAWMAARGYVVLYTNPRGSTTYGQEFGNAIQHHYPGDDYHDLMAGVDALVARGYIDTERMGVTGGSGGGILTNWTIAHTSRFGAAVSQRSIADWAGFWYTTDFTLFQPTWFKAAPWEDPADFAARSPITHVARIETPLMLIEGEADLRTPPGDGGEQMFRALKFLKRPVVMVRFPDETHELSRSGRPSHRIARLRHIVAWFDKHLRGVSTDSLGY